MNLLYKKLRTTRGVLGALLLGFMLLAVIAVQAQTVTTDKADYYPGETVTITGSGWTSDADVLLVIEHLIFTNHENDTLTAIVTSGGFINDAYIISSLDIGEQFRLTAIGQTSGKTAVTYFTDGNANSGNGLMTVDPVFVCGGGSGLTYTFTFSGGTGNLWNNGSALTMEVPWNVPLGAITTNTPINSPVIGLITRTNVGSGTLITIPFYSGTNNPGFNIAISGVTMPAFAHYRIPVQTMQGSGGTDPLVLKNINIAPEIASSSNANGSIVGAKSSCGSVNSGSLDFYGYTGTIDRWERRQLTSLNPITWGGWITINNHSDSYNLNANAVSTTTQFRVITTEASCGVSIGNGEYSSDTALVAVVTTPVIIASNITSYGNFTPNFGEGFNVIVYSVPPATSVIYKVGSTPILPGYTFDAGTTSVTVTATNMCASSTATFTVNTGIPPQISCPANITVNTSFDDLGDCDAVVSYTLTWDGESATATPTTGHYIGSPQPTLIYSLDGGTTTNTGTGSGSTFPKGTTTVQLTATNSAGSANCSFTVTVLDNENPTVTATTDVNANTGDDGDYDCDVELAITNAVFDDNCPGEILAWLMTGVTTGSGSGQVGTFTFNKGVTTITYTVTDAEGHTATDAMTVTVVDNQNPTVTATADVNANTGDDGDYDCDVELAITNAVFDDNCPGETLAWVMTGVTTGSGSGQVGTYTFNKGVTTITYTVTDAEGHTATDAMTVIVVDNQKPTIICPANLEIATDPGLCYATNVALGTPTVSDNCPGVVSPTNNAPIQFPFGPTEVIWLVYDASGNSNSCTQIVNVNRIRTITTVTVTPSIQQYSEPVTMVAHVTPWNCPSVGCTATGTVTFTIGEQEMGVAILIGGTATLTTQLCGDFGQDLSIYDVSATFTPTACEAYVGSTGVCEDCLEITPEDACLKYSGVYFASTESPTKSTAIVTLAVTVFEEAGNLCDISSAKVEFFSGTTATGTLIAIVPIGLVNENDPSVGVGTYDWNVDIGQSDGLDFTVSAKIIGYYQGEGCDENEFPIVITVSKPLDDFITGGGYNVLTNSNGIMRGDNLSRNNFGFNVKFNKKRTNLQGRINTIIRRTLNDGRHTFQVKGNVMSSLTTKTFTLYNWALFTGKASIQDITDIIEHPEITPLSGDGNATIQFEMSDYGEPGTMDMLGITIWNKSGGLWFSNNWNGTKTAQQTISGGNLVVHITPTKTAEVVTQIDGKTDLLVYPNPFRDKLRFEFIAPADTYVRISLFDITGRMVQTVFDSEVKGGVDYNADFKPVTNVSGMYFYRATIGDQVFNGKVMYKQ